MSLSLANIIVTFAAATDASPKLVPIQKVQMGKLDISQSPASLQSGKDDSQHQLVFTPNDAHQPLDESSKIIVNFGPGATGIANRDAAYAAVVAATTSV